LIFFLYINLFSVWLLHYRVILICSVTCVYFSFGFGVLFFSLIIIVHSLCFVFIGLFCGKDLTHRVMISLFILYATCANYVYNVLIQGAAVVEIVW